MQGKDLKLFILLNILILSNKTKSFFFLYRTGTDIVISAGRKQCRNHLTALKQHLSETLAKVRQTLASKVSSEGDGGLSELQALLVMPTIEKVKGILQDLVVGIDT